MKTPLERRKTPEQGAATSVLPATSPLLEGICGRYFVDCNEAAPCTHRTEDMSGVAPYALDPANANRLWEERWESSVRAWLRLCDPHLLCEIGVEHPRRKKSGQSPVLETLRNDCVACFRFRRAECHVDGFAQTLKG